MNGSDYRYVLDLSRLDGTPLGSFAAQTDWTPAVEWGRLQALRAWRNPDKSASARVAIQPLWHASASGPAVRGLRVVASANGCTPVADEIPLTYFRSLAVKISHALVEQKTLAAGDQFHFSVAAFPSRTPAHARPGDDPAFEEIPVSVPLGRASLSALRRRSSVMGELDAGDLPVFVPQRVVCELIQRTEQAGPNEAGAILLGDLHANTDPGGQDVLLQVNAQVPALHAVAETTRLSLTAATWDAVNAALALRRSREHLVGWHHSHPARFWCTKECSPEARARCPLGQPFFSSEDCALHRTVFWKAHSVALLITNGPAAMNVAMFGWHRGLIRPRGFYLLDPVPSAAMPALSAPTPIIGDPPHETTCS
ncbi:MAG: hypothetical protein JXQ71_12875 [Verrucomicrobia bacterium]|nr:hypothetical protein [Verrucomicrobiota bacterium]